ncbi:MAG: ATP-binding cassette domain-containing protein [Solirubrobacterales bacterium]
MDRANAIEVVGLKKRYGDEVQALDGISFVVPAGTVFGLLGPNGAGKSTTVKILTTLSSADQGEASVAGHDVAREPDAVRRAIGVVAQKSTVDREATARENVRLQGQVYGMRGEELEARIDELLARFNLSDAADRIARTLSGGMERRLNIAMALVHRPRILFLDEPTTGLDPEVRAEMWEELGELASEQGMTILLTTHYLEEADLLASHLVIVDRGKIVAEGSPEELKRELRGDALRIELDSDRHNGELTEALAGVEGVREVVVDGRVLHARAEDGARAVPAVLQALEARGAGAASVTVARPSLDDVYLRYAGRTFERAEADDNQGAS